MLPNNDGMIHVAYLDSWIGKVGLYTVVNESSTY